MSACEIIPKRIETFEMRLFEKEIDLAEFLCYYYDISYEQLFIKLIHEHAEHKLANNPTYKYPYF